MDSVEVKRFVNSVEERRQAVTPQGDQWEAEFQLEEKETAWRGSTVSRAAGSSISAIAYSVILGSTDAN